MDILEYFYDNKPKNRYYYPRKLALPHNKSFSLIGTRGTGKSTLVIDYLNSLSSDDWLYIDCQDPVFAIEDIDDRMLGEFVEQEDISLVVLDHFYEGFIDIVRERHDTIYISRDKISNYDGLTLQLHGLDYEEFLSFGRSSMHKHSFNNFLRAGTLPIASLSDMHTLARIMREFFYSSFGEDEGRLILILARFHGRKVTTHQIYTYAREYFRISKDWVYRTTKRLEAEGIIYFIKDTNQSNIRKLLLYDHALAKYLSKEQPFGITFDSLIALALIKHGYKIYMFDNQGYLTDNHLTLPSPFESHEHAWKKQYDKAPHYKKSNITKVWLITVSEHYYFKISGVEFEGIPFYEWSIVTAPANEPSEISKSSTLHRRN